MNLSSSVLLVTGGSSGLGAAVVQMALEADAQVVIADLTAPNPSAFKPEWSERWVHVQTNVADEDAAGAAVRMALDRFHRLDVLVNAAGIAPAEKIHGRNGPHRFDVFKKTLDVNVLGSFNMMRLAVPGFLASEPRPDCSQGVIINTASVAAYDGQIGQTAYAASKGAIVAMTLPAARELARDRIRVMTIAPGIFETPMLKGLPADVQTALAADIPHPSRLGHPSEFASLVRQIIENEYLNGEVIRLDGAIRLAPK